MRSWTVRDEVRGPETIDRGETAELVRQQLELPGSPPLGIERTVPVGGPTRPPVILVHGLAQNRITWRLSRRSFSGFLAARGYEVLNLELRGHGRSRALGAPNATSFHQYVEDLERTIDQVPAPFVIGHSLGGGVGIGASLTRHTLGLVHLAGVWRFGAHNRTLRALARLTLRLEPQLMRAPVRMSTGWAGALLGQLYAVTDVAGYGAPIAGWAPDSIERDLLEERLATGFDWTSVEVWLQMARWATGHPFEYAAPFLALDRPLLVIAGDADPLVTPDDVRDLVDASRSSDKELWVYEPFEQAVHWGHVDLILGRYARKLVWPRIAQWLDDRC